MPPSNNRATRIIGAAAGAIALVVVTLVLIGPAPSRDQKDGANNVPAGAVPAGQTAPAPCASCHAPIVEAYRGHGMSRSIGQPRDISPGSVVNPRNGARYELTSTGGTAWLTSTGGGGGVRRQKIVARIGAGIFDTSWITTDVDPANSVGTGRLFFAPVETVTGKGLQLSPFDLHPDSAGTDMALTRECLTCHTLDRVGGNVAHFPANQLGATAFDEINPLRCSACHGESEHADSARLGQLDPGAQRDVCARCHLQGDARIDLVNAAPDRAKPIAGQIPVLVPQAAHQDFRFVGQLERLALSGCFKASSAMTCTTCHDPHTGVRAQGVASFERACVRCHAGAKSHARSDSGCIDCHVRRSQPFDLPHVTTVDHFIRRRIEPAAEVPHRQFSDRTGTLAIYDDGRLRGALATAAGKRWANGVMAMGMLSMGRFKEAARLLDAFPAPGTPAARVPSAPLGLAPLESLPAFHTVRGYALIGSGNIEAAGRAFADAIALDPSAADARMARARISLDNGDLQGALLDTQAVITAFPAAEQPWDLRIEIAQRNGRPDLALSAADASTRVWPFNPRVWATLARLARAGGDQARAERALDRARTLRP